MTTLTLNRLSAAIGAEVTGLTSDRLASDDALPMAIREALEEHGVLLFRGLHLEPEAQVAFCSKLGQVDENEGHHLVRGIYRISLDTTKNSSADYLHATFDWHIDGCTPLNGECPQMVTLLSAKAVADHGGETEFASTYMAYDLLDDEEKEWVKNLRVVHSLEASQRQRHPDPTPELTARWKARPVSEHPLVWTHLDGRKSLVIGASADYIVNVNIDEGRRVLDDLLARATQPEFVYRHSWSVGDTVIWDNRGVLHRAIPYAADSPRELLRTTVLGDEPIR
jgi:alpha-ketoglutarate-dependent taurine dioxygenase